MGAQKGIQMDMENRRWAQGIARNRAKDQEYRQRSAEINLHGRASLLMNKLTDAEKEAWKYAIVLQSRIGGKR